MAIVPVITSAVKKFSGKPLAVTSKALGIASIASVLYDSHINGREKAYSLDQVASAERYSNQFHKFMTMEKPSATVAMLKRNLYETEMQSNLPHLFTRAKGYCIGFGNTLLNNIHIIGLSALAIKFKNVGKVAGVALSAVGLKTILYDVLGIGAEKKERNY